MHAAHVSICIPRTMTCPGPWGQRQPQKDGPPPPHLNVSIPNMKVRSTSQANLILVWYLHTSTHTCAPVHTHTLNTRARMHARMLTHKKAHTITPTIQLVSVLRSLLFPLGHFGLVQPHTCVARKKGLVMRERRLCVCVRVCVCVCVRVCVCVFVCDRK